LSSKGYLLKSEFKLQDRQLCVSLLNNPKKERKKNKKIPFIVFKGKETICVNMWVYIKREWSMCYDNKERKKKLRVRNRHKKNCC
jgi:hypothetical protein